MNRANDSSPQHDAHELSNQSLLFERLHVLHESKQLKKCMLSAYLMTTYEFRHKVMGYLGLIEESFYCRDDYEPAIWLRSTKLPLDGEGLADEGFEHVDRCFARFNRVRFPRVLRSRKVKQHDVIELASKADYYNLRHTSEVVFSF